MESRDMSLLFFLLIAGTFYAVHGWNVEASASEAMLDQNATIRCDLDTNDVPPGFLAIKAGNTNYVGFNFFGGQLSLDPSTVNPRYSYEVDTRTMTIKNVECSDELTFECHLTVFTTQSETKSSSATITVKVAPKVPSPMTTNPSNLTGGVKEGDSVSAQCNANIGRQGKGRIQWRVYRSSSNPQVIDDENFSQNDLSIATTDSSAAQGEPVCSRRKISRITFSNLKVSDQNLVVACFVLNSDFPKDPQNCESPQASICQQSETIRIHYSVRAITTSRAPASGDIVEGRNVRLVCQADGFPDPRYEWTKLGHNGTLEGSGAAELVLSNVGLDASGNYSCTAINVVEGVHYNTTAPSIEIIVVKPPPTTTPDPTEPTTDGGDGSGHNGSPSPSSGSSDNDTVTIVVVIVVLVVVVALIILGIVIYKKRQAKKDPPRPKDIPFYNNKQSMGGPPDVLADDKKKPIGGHLNSSFDTKNEDGLMYADLTYDNRPRSRKPMAIGDTSSEYSDVQMPQV